MVLEGANQSLDAFAGLLRVPLDTLLVVQQSDGQKLATDCVCLFCGIFLAAQLFPELLDSLPSVKQV